MKHVNALTVSLNIAGYLNPANLCIHDCWDDIQKNQHEAAKKTHLRSYLGHEYSRSHVLSAPKIPKRLMRV